MFDLFLIENFLIMFGLVFCVILIICKLFLLSDCIFVSIVFFCFFVNGVIVLLRLINLEMFNIFLIVFFVIICVLLVGLVIIIFIW